MSDAGVIFKKMADDAKRKGLWLEYVDMSRLLNHDCGLSAINSLPRNVPDAEYRNIVRHAWTWSHNIWENRAGWRMILEGKRRKLGSFTSPGDIERLQQMRNPLAIYRGCSEKNQYGFSWTTDKVRAEYFAGYTQGWTGSAQRFLVSGTVKHAHVIAYISSRNEEEIVVLPEHVSGISCEDITHRKKLTECMMKRIGKAPK